jgi:hypothetical protein
MKAPSIGNMAHCLMVRQRQHPRNRGEYWPSNTHQTAQVTKTDYVFTYLSALYSGDVAMVLKLHPVGLVQLWPNEKVQVRNLVVFANKSGSQTQLAMCIHDCQHTTEHLCWNGLYLWKHTKISLSPYQVCDCTSESTKKISLPHWDNLLLGLALTVLATRPICNGEYGIWTIYCPFT